MQVKDSDANHQPRGGPRPELSTHAARCAPRRGACEHGQRCTGPRTPVPTGAQRPSCWDRSIAHPRSYLHLGWGPVPPLGVGVLYSWLWSPRPPNQQPPHPISALLCRKTPTHKDPVLFLEHSSGGRDPSGSFPPSLRGSPLPQSPPLSPGFTAAPCTAGDGWTSRASGGSCPSSRPSGQSSTPASPQKSCPTPRAVLPTRVQHRAEVQLWDERSPTLQAETLLLPLTEASPLLGSLAPLPAHLPALPQEVLRKHRLPTAVRRHKSSSQNITSATTLSW